MRHQDDTHRDRAHRNDGFTQPMIAGLVTAVVGFTSSFVLVLTGLRAVGADPRQAVSGLLLLCVAMGGLAVVLGLRHRQPLSFAWSTPGAALLVSAGHQHGYGYAVGAFLVAGLLVTVTGLWSRLGALVAAIPVPLATALLAGVLLPLCLAPVHAAVQLPALALPVVISWALLTRFARRWATPGALLVTVVVLLLRHPAAMQRLRDSLEAGEDDYAFQFESPHFITLGILYEGNARFAGGAFAPILRRVDKFLKGHFPRTLTEREERAELVRAADIALGQAVAKLAKRGIRHPYVKNFVLARTTPLTRQRKTLPGFDQTFRKLVENVEAFDVGKVRYEDIQRSAIMSAPAAG